jgi:hypothetical protein
VDPRYGPPTFVDGAQGYAGRGPYPDIRTVLPEKLDFDRFWADLEVIRSAACTGGGLCLSRSLNPGLGLADEPVAWMLEPTATGPAGAIRVSAAFGKRSAACLSSEEWWWVRSREADWELLGTFPVPANGAVWVDGHAILGKPGEVGIVAGAMTIYAGRAESPRNIVIAGDIAYATADRGTDVLGLISSDEIIIDPAAIGSDGRLEVSAAMLEQGGTMRVALDCGATGKPIERVGDNAPVLHTFGSQARRETGNMSSQFAARNYEFDTRLEWLRPPLFPLLDESWSYRNWREVLPPCWARTDGPDCSGS